MDPLQPVPVRPIGIGNCLRRVIWKCLDRQHGQGVRGIALPENLYSISGCRETLAADANLYFQTKMTPDRTDYLPGYICLVGDMRNMYNCAKRARMLAEVRDSDDPEVKKLLVALHCDLYPMSPIVAFTASGRRFLDYRSVEGGQQGATSAVVGVPLACKEGFRRTRTFLEENSDGSLRAGVDDFVMYGPANTVYEALDVLREVLREAGLEFREDKFRAYSPAGPYRPGLGTGGADVCPNYGRKPDFIRVAEKSVRDPLLMLDILRAEALGEITEGEAEARRAAVEHVRISGLTIWGAAVTADDQFINHYLLENVTAVLDATLHEIIPTLGADSDVLQTVIKNQVVTRLTHEGRTTPPRLTRPFFRVVDEVLCKLRVMHVCGGIDPYDNDFDARRVGLPVRAGGFGWRKLEDTAVPAYLGVHGMIHGCRWQAGKSSK